MSSTESGAPVPFHGPGRAPAGRRLLLLSYHFPPSTTAGTLRWQKFAAAAAEHGWGLDVVTLDPEALPSRDDARFADLPPGTRIFGVPPTASRSQRLDSLLTRMMKWWRSRSAPADRPRAGGPVAAKSVTESITPDLIRWSLRPAELRRAYGCWIAFSQDAAWSKAAARMARRVRVRGVHGAIISCGPPHMVHDAASSLAHSAGIPHVMDLRDPWSQRRRLPAPLASPLWLALARRHERPAVRRASLVVANTDDLRRALAEAYPQATVMTAMNGLDDDIITPRGAGDRFVIAYAGALYLDRDPRPLFAAAARIIERRRLTPAQFGILLVGDVATYENRPMSALAADAGIEAFVTVMPRQPRGAMFALLADAAVLLSLQQDSAYAVPSKVFEYLQFEAWTVAITGPDTPTARVLEGVEADVVPPGDAAALEQVLDRRYGKWSAGERPGRPRGSERLQRRAQARKLFDAIDGITRGADR